MGIEYLFLTDIDEFMDISKRCHADSDWADYAFDREVCKKNIAEICKGGFACVYRKNNEIVGFFLATLGSPLFSNRLFGMECGVYIVPEHRGGRVALLMYREFRQWCDKHDAEPLVEIYFSDDETNSKTYNFFRKSGMIECGKIFRGGQNGLH